MKKILLVAVLSSLFFFNNVSAANVPLNKDQLKAKIAEIVRMIGLLQAQLVEVQKSDTAAKETIALANPLINTPPANATLCNGTYWRNCSNGQDFVCPATGEAFCQNHQTYVAPATSNYTFIPKYDPGMTPEQNIKNMNGSTVVVALPTVEQQKQACQNQYSLSVISLGDGGVQNATNNYNNVVAQTYQIVDNCGANGMCSSGARNAAQQQRDQAKASLNSVTASYQTTLQTYKDSLQSCLSVVIQR